MLLGARGLLGTALRRMQPKDIEIHGFDHTELDITRYDQLAAALARLSPDVVVNAAAFTEVDRAESVPAEAFAVNAAAVGNLGRMAASSGTRVAQFSTDYVFDGKQTHPYTESDVAAPLSTYGASKLAGEVALEASGALTLLVRTQAIFGPAGRSFPKTMQERAKAGQPSRVVADQVGRFTYSLDLAAAVWDLLRLNVTGTVHITNAKDASWFEVAAAVYGAAGCPELCTPCTTAEYPTPAVRPLYSSLCTARLERLLGRPLPDWPLSLQRFLMDAAN